MSTDRDVVFYKTVTEENWPDMQRLFGDRGAYGGCWCTYWRIKRSKFSSMSPSERKDAIENIIFSGNSPGILAYVNDTPVGWCSFGRREEFQSLENSRVLKRVDDKEVWSIVCFYIERNQRKKGVMKGLLREAVRVAESRGASIIEGYPIDPPSGHYPDPYAYTGLMSAFKDAGFVEVARRSDKRPVMRYYVNPEKRE